MILGDFYSLSRIHAEYCGELLIIVISFGKNIFLAEGKAVLELREVCDLVVEER